MYFPRFGFRSYRILSLFALLIIPFFVQAQVTSESVYSSQKFDPNNPARYSTPVFWIGLLVVVALIVLYVLRKQREKS